mgnify:CR=1 FL=1
MLVQHRKAYLSFSLHREGSELFVIVLSSLSDQEMLALGIQVPFHDMKAESILSSARLWDSRMKHRRLVVVAP